MDTMAFDRAHLWCFRAKLIRVVDGDTFVALVDTGFSGRHEVNVRLADFSAPERNEEGGAEATVYLHSILDRAGTWPLRIITQQKETIVAEQRSFIRYVAYVWIDNNGQLVDLRTILVIP